MLKLRTRSSSIHHKRVNVEKDRIKNAGIDGRLFLLLTFPLADDMAFRPADSWTIRLIAFFLQCCGFWSSNSRLVKIAMDVLTVYTFVSVSAAIFITVIDGYQSYGDFNVSYEVM